MRIVVDTNVFVSSFFGGNPRRIIDLWKNGEVSLCLSRDILDEYIEVLERMGLEDKEELKELLVLFSKGFNIVFTTKTPKISVVQADPDDDKFIECAIALNAEAIVTGDKALGNIKKYREIRILTPAQFLNDYR
jgi:putative PIN family toxin of toxin-antitoxin system